jgi:hypothetical protein
MNMYGCWISYLQIHPFIFTSYELHMIERILGVGTKFNAHSSYFSLYIVS